VAKKWRELYDKTPANRRARIETRVAATLAEMPLQELRRARDLSQVRLVETLGVEQSEISRIEHRVVPYTHDALVTDEAAAQTSSQAIRDLVNAVRFTTRLSKS
jgi:predicted XRE-type DNA-binding protein